MHCTACSAPINHPARFCPGCGAASPAPPAASSRGVREPPHWSLIIFWTVVGVLALLPMIFQTDQAGEPQGGGIAFALILGMGIVLWSCFGTPAPRTGMQMCKQCGTVSRPVYFDAGSGLLELFLIFMFLVPGIFYHFWRRSRQYWGCGACDSNQIIPIDSPAAVAALQGK